MQAAAEPVSSDGEDKPVEPDLLDELRATSNEYFAGTYQSRAASPSSESMAAHTLVAVAANGHVDPHQQQQLMYMDGGGGGGVFPVQQQAAAVVRSDNVGDGDQVMMGMTGFSSFSNFYGATWMDDGFSDTQTQPWEISWDVPPNDYFVNGMPRMGPVV